MLTACVLLNSTLKFCQNPPFSFNLSFLNFPVGVQQWYRSIYIYIYLNSLKPNSIVFICYRLRQQTQSGVQCGDRIHRPHLCHHGCRAHYVSSWPGFCLPEGEGERFLFNYSFLKCLQLVERIENGLRYIKAEITSWTMSVCPYLWSCLYAVWHISVE